MEFANTRVGVGVIIEKDNKILIGKRKGSHAPYYSIPGGNLELGESFEEAAIREIQEETNLLISEPKVISVVNDLVTFEQEKKHYISIILYSNIFTGELINLEPDKCENLFWVNPNELPYPHFEASKQAINCFLNRKFYLESQPEAK